MPAPAPVPPEFLTQYDAERARILRRRAVFYCLAVLALLGLSWSVTLDELFRGVAFTGGDSMGWPDILMDSLYTATFGSALVYFALRPRSRPEIVRAFQWVIAVVGVTAVAATPLVSNASWIPGATLDHTPETDRAQAIASLGTVFVLHFLASVFVALSPREGLVPFIPILAAFALWVVFVSVGSAAQRAALILASPLAGLPGLVWSWWRYRSFTDRFHARAVHKRYAEVTRELTDARRVHEALFPPPITRGPVHVTYTYEPMSAIGGDFLFVRPLSFPPSQPAGPIVVVLIDVTGHGIAAALAVNRIHAELQRICAEGATPPDAVIAALNTFACDSLAPQAMFATAVCLRVVPPAQPGANCELQWAGAGHPPALLRAADGTVRRLDSTAPMLGVIDAEMFQAALERRPLGSGETVIAYTDGAIEATDAAGRELGIVGLEALLAAAPPVGRTFADALAAAVARHRTGSTADDLLIVQLSPSPAP
ncbi:MAG TPA: PP2C family protein-serine/threonine phosphatase [Phycisphaerales bacterium]|nr:PP2C family protein-serine/threonine phosphatase [Phycisphaerales bacterium]